MTDEQLPQTASHPKETAGNAGILKRVKKSLNFKKMSRSEAFFTIFFVALIILAIGIYAYTILFDSTFLTSLVVKNFVVPLGQSGLWRIPLYYGFMFLQVIITPIPSELIQMVGGIIFDWWWGALLSYTGIVVTSFFGYYIAQRGGAKVIGATIGEKNVKGLDILLAKYGIWAMIVLRGIPFIQFDLVTYGAGLVNMNKRDFVIGSAIGAAPRSIIYAWLGSILFPGGISKILEMSPNALTEYIESNSTYFNNLLAIIFAIVGLGFLLFNFVILPRVRKSETKKMRIIGLEKLFTVIQGSNRVEINEFARNLGMSKDDVLPLLIEWAAEYNLELSQDYIVFEESRKADFLAKLKSMFGKS